MGIEPTSEVREGSSSKEEGHGAYMRMAAFAASCNSIDWIGRGGGDRTKVGVANA
jgi:hypothetical protein